MRSRIYKALRLLRVFHWVHFAHYNCKLFVVLSVPLQSVSFYVSMVFSGVFCVLFFLNWDLKRETDRSLICHRSPFEVCQFQDEHQDLKQTYFQSCHSKARIYEIQVLAEMRVTPSSKDGLRWIWLNVVLSVMKLLTF